MNKMTKVEFLWAISKGNLPLINGAHDTKEIDSPPFITMDDIDVEWCIRLTVKRDPSKPDGENITMSCVLFLHDSPVEWSLIPATYSFSFIDGRDGKILEEATENKPFQFKQGHEGNGFSWTGFDNHVKVSQCENLQIYCKIDYDPAQKRSAAKPGRRSKRKAKRRTKRGPAGANKKDKSTPAKKSKASAAASSHCPKNCSKSSNQV